MKSFKQIVQPLLEAIGYYKIKAKWRWHQYISNWQKVDAQRKAEALAWIEAIDHRLLPDVKENDNVTVSLTSHSKRVTDFAPFAIYSIFHQIVLPNRIVLNINQEKWNDDNLPELIKKLQIAGLEVNFCEDVGPHTKLLPTLQKYPDDIIITVDDDVYYDKELIEELLTEKKKFKEPKVVICRIATEVIFYGAEIAPYSQWPETRELTENRLSPLGWGGVLYMPHVFSDEIFNKQVYRSLCPYADDIWFTAMEMIADVPVRIVHNSKWTGKGDVDHTNEYVAHVSDALHFQNAEAGGNDVQLVKLIEYYNLNQYAKQIL